MKPLLIVLLTLGLSVLTAQSAENPPGSILHITGYAHTGLAYSPGASGSFTIGSFSPIFHFLYNEIMLMESELEIEAEADGQTALNLEYLTLDLFLGDYATLVLGKYLSPVGQFKQNLHPSWINKLPSAPLGFGHDGVAPSSDIGLQLRGGWPLGKQKLVYALAVENGPQYVMEEEGHDEEAGWVLAHRGFNRDDNQQKVISGRFSWLPRPNMNVAFSFSNGQVLSPENQDLAYALVGGDWFWRPGGLPNLEFRAETLTRTVGDETVSAGYAQGAYRVFDHLEAVVRSGYFSNAGDESTQWALGLNYLFSSNVLAKVAWEQNNSDDFTDQLLVQLAFGF